MFCVLNRLTQLVGFRKYSLRLVGNKYVLWVYAIEMDGKDGNEWYFTSLPTGSTVLLLISWRLSLRFNHYSVIIFLPILHHSLSLFLSLCFSFSMMQLLRACPAVRACCAVVESHRPRTEKIVCLISLSLSLCVALREEA